MDFFREIICEIWRLLRVGVESFESLNWVVGVFPPCCSTQQTRNPVSFKCRESNRNSSVVVMYSEHLASTCFTHSVGCYQRNVKRFGFSVMLRCVDIVNRRF